MPAGKLLVEVTVLELIGLVEGVEVVTTLEDEELRHTGWM